MRPLLLFLVATLGLQCLAESLTRVFQNPDYAVSHPVHPHKKLCFQFAIKHDEEDLELLETKFWAVSDPEGSDYGKHLSIQQLAVMMEPEQRKVKTVAQWLRSVPLLDYHLNKHQDVIRACMQAQHAEKLMDTKFAVYHHRHSHEDADPLSPYHRRLIRNTQSLSLPETVASCLDFIGGANTPVHLKSKNIRSEVPKSPKTESPNIRADGGQNFEMAAMNMNMMMNLASQPEPFALHSHDDFVKAPELIKAVGGVGQIEVHFRLYCANHQLNNVSEPIPPCAEPRTSRLISLVALVKDASGLETPRMVTIADPACNSHGKCVVVVGGVRNFLPVTISLRAFFADGRSSRFSSASSPTISFEYATIAFLKDLYGIPRGLQCKTGKSSQSVVEFGGQYYNRQDLATFLHYHGVPQQAVDRLVGFNNETEGALTGGESQLDIQYIMGIAPGCETWFWSMEGTDNITNDEPFLKWLLEIAETPDAPLVHSVSYGDDEALFPPYYSHRINVEFKKMALRGMTVLVSSGDDGCHGTEARTHPHKCDRAYPEFPTSSPYVLSVGATAMSYVASPLCTHKSCWTLSEQASSAGHGHVVTSGGGFSEQHKRPRYQDKVVERYLNNRFVKLPRYDGNKTHDRPPFFNVHGRAYPDIAGYANLYLTIMNGELSPVSGTSASTPLLAGIITLWNDMRFAAGLPPVGFLNPLLYKLYDKHPEIFNDVVMGDNKCTVSGIACCKEGFEAAVGWDPVTGLGTPRFRDIGSLLVNEHNRYPFMGQDPLIALETGTTTTLQWLSPAMMLTIFFLSLISLLVSFCLMIRLWKASPGTSVQALGERTPLISHLVHSNSINNYNTPVFNARR